MTDYLKNLAREIATKLTPVGVAILKKHSGARGTKAALEWYAIQPTKEKNSVNMHIKLALGVDVLKEYSHLTDLFDPNYKGSGLFDFKHQVAEVLWRDQ